MRSNGRRAPRQTELDLRFDRNGQHRGGARRGAGRPAKGPRSSEPHQTRAELDPRHPQHVTMRVDADVGWLRRMDAYRAIRAALARVVSRGSFRIVHISVQGNHIHALCEADDRMALARGLQAFQISAAKAINRVVSKRRRTRRRGRVFTDRYHVESIDSVRQVRHALAYVLNNWRRHRVDGEGLFGDRVDPYASGALFEGWRAAIETWPWPDGYEPPAVCRPQTWLLAQGWKRAGTISMHGVPGPRARNQRV